MPDPAGLTPRELRRKLVHMGVGGFAFSLRFLSRREAALGALLALVFNWQVLPRIGGKALWREGERERGYARGILFYPLSVLGLIVFLGDEPWMVAAVWGVLAFGDGMASLAGLAAPGPRLPWNADKGWPGFLAFLCFGTLGSSILAAWTWGMPLAAWASPRILALTAPLTLACALVESMPSTLDDNLTVPLVGGIVLPLLAGAEPTRLLTDPDLGHRLALGLEVNVAVAVLAWLLRAIDLPGAVSAVVLGVAVTAGLGLPGFAVMAAFFVAGSAVTRLGHETKAARGIAQDRGGARGWRNAWANGGVPAFLALLAGMSALGDTRALLTLAYAAAVATAAADTCSSEVGKAFGRRTVLITSGKAVPPGTEGAISLEGTLSGLLGGFFVASIGATLGLFGFGTAALAGSAGFLGSLAESVIGTRAEREGWMGNDLLNFLNTAIGAGIAALLARGLAAAGTALS